MTLDLPTPPLPDEISSGRVFESFLANGTARPSAWPWAWPRAGGRSGVAVQRAAQVLAVLVGHHGELEIDRVDTVEFGGGVGHTPLDLGLQRTSRHGQCDQHADDAVAHDRDAAQHAEIDDRAVQFGVLDGTQGLDDLLFGDDGSAHGAQCGDAAREFALRR